MYEHLLRCNRYSMLLTTSVQLPVFPFSVYIVYCLFGWSVVERDRAVEQRLYFGTHSFSRVQNGLLLLRPGLYSTHVRMYSVAVGILCCCPRPYSVAVFVVFRFFLSVCVVCTAFFVDPSLSKTARFSNVDISSLFPSRVSKGDSATGTPRIVLLCTGLRSFYAYCVVWR